jgi:hypothetical protein
MQGKFDGPCAGGPCDGGRIAADAQTVDVPFLVKGVPGICRGSYKWQPDARIWVWQSQWPISAAAGTTP